MSDLKITSLVSCILHITKVCMKSLFIVIQESNIVIPYQVSMVHMFYLWHIFGAFGRFRAIPASFSQPCLVSMGYLCKYSWLDARWHQLINFVNPILTKRPTRRIFKARLFISYMYDQCTVPSELIEMIFLKYLDSPWCRPIAMFLCLSNFVVHGLQLQIYTTREHTG